MEMILRRQKEKTTNYSSNMKEGKKNMNLKKFLSIIVAGVLALSSMSFTVMADELEVELPTATVTELEATEETPLTFALNFTADEPTPEQYETYKKWYVDYILTVNQDVTFNADESADGYLAGSYEWYNNGEWIKVPFEDVTLNANEPFMIMDYAKDLVGRINYEQICGQVMSFNCGVFFEEEFMAAHPDLEVKLELVIWDNHDESEKKYSIGSYVFDTKEDKVEKPSGTVTEITKENADFAMSFEADTLTAEQVETYGDWNADFELVFNKDVVLNADGTKDGYISVCENGVWKNVPNQDVEVKAGEVIKVREFAKQYGSEGISLAAASNNDFSFAVVLADEYLQQYPDFEAEATLTMTNPQNLAQTYQIDKTYTFKAQEFKANSISVEYRDVTEADAEGYKLYDIVLKSGDGYPIHELASADLTFDFDCTYSEYNALTYEVTPAADFTLTQTGKVGEEDRYMFSYKGVDNKFEGSGEKITIGQIKVAGYGKFTLKTAIADENIVNATKLNNNIVDSFVVNGGTDGKTGKLVINDDTDTTDDLVGEIEETEIKHIQKNLTINVEFPNSVNENVAEYQDMKVTIAGANDTETINLADFTSADNKGYTITRELDQYFKYTVTVEGAGYRTVSYTVTMDDNKTLNFWNNVMDEDTEVEVNKPASATPTTFLAGDIVKDANINIYDLSAVVAYFGEVTDTTKKSDYSKYDLNRDGYIDSKDVAYVLVSWNK